MEQQVEFSDILEYLVKKRGMSQLALAVEECFTPWLKREKGCLASNVQRYLNEHTAGDLHNKIKKAAADPLAGKQLTVAEVAEFLRRVRMRPEVLIGEIGSRAPFPFQKFREGSIVKVFIAKRMANNLGGQGLEAGWPRASHGSRDVLAVADLINVLGRDLQLEYELDLVAVPPVTNSKPGQKSPEEILEGHIEAKGTGAIVSLGSGPHNQISNAIAKIIFNDCENGLPVQFRWTDKERKQSDFLDDTADFGRQLPDHKAGIWHVQGEEANFLDRETDKFVRVYCADGNNHNRTHFYDCGMLAIDVRHRVPLILAAGHGGNATRACIQALGYTGLINKAMDAFPMEGRFVGCLVVSRTKASTEVIDDLTLAYKKGRGRPWYFYKMNDLQTDHGLSAAKPAKVILRK